MSNTLITSAGKVSKTKWKSSELLVWYKSACSACSACSAAFQVEQEQKLRNSAAQKLRSSATQHHISPNAHLAYQARTPNPRASPSALTCTLAFGLSSIFLNYVLSFFVPLFTFLYFVFFFLISKSLFFFGCVCIRFKIFFNFFSLLLVKSRRELCCAGVLAGYWGRNQHISSWNIRRARLIYHANST